MYLQTAKMFTVLDRVQKAFKGIDKNQLNECDFDAEACRYDATVTDHNALRTIVKRLAGPFTVYLSGTDGWAIDVTRKALLELLYCDESQCGMSLSCDGQKAEVSVYRNCTNIEFKWG